MKFWWFSVLSLFLGCFLPCLNAVSNADSAWYLNKVAANETGLFDSSRVHVLRLGPNEDLLDSLFRYARVLNIKAASVVSVVGSLTQTNIRYANQEDTVIMKGHFEIISVVGNIDLQKSASEGSGHIHLSVSDGKGVTTGGHAVLGNIVYTTAEITLLEMTTGRFDRVLDSGVNGSGYYELQVFHEQN